MDQSSSSPTALTSAQSGKSLQPELKATRHYRLTTEEWLQAVHNLKPRERDVLYYLRTLDPFGDRRLDISVREISRILKCDPATVSRALKTLDAKGYITLELVNARVKVLSVGNGVVWKQRGRSVDNMGDRETTAQIVRQHERSPHNDRAPQSAPDIDSGSPHTLHTDQTIQTPSHSHPPDERDLLKFVIAEIKKDKQIRQPRAYAKQCLEKDREFWIEKFVEWQGEHDRIKRSAASPPSTDFELKQIEQRRALLLENWKIPRLRNKIREAITIQPELQLEIVGDELREVEP